MSFFSNGVEVPTSVEGGVTGISYTAGSQSVGTNTDYVVYAPNPGSVVGFIQPGTEGQLKTAINGGSINLRNTNDTTAKTAVWLKTAHTTG